MLLLVLLIQKLHTNKRFRIYFSFIANTHNNYVNWEFVSLESDNLYASAVLRSSFLAIVVTTLRSYTANVHCNQMKPGPIFCKLYIYQIIIILFRIKILLKNNVKDEKSRGKTNIELCRWIMTCVNIRPTNNTLFSASKWWRQTALCLLERHMNWG